MSSIYGCLNLSPISELNLTVPALSPNDEEVIRGYHLVKDDNGRCIFPGYFMFKASEKNTVFVPSRQEKIDASFIGKINHPQGLSFLIRLLLMLNSEKNNMKLSDIVYEKLYSHLEAQGHYLAVISQTGAHSKMIFLSKGIKLYLIGVTDGLSNFLIWSNEVDLELRMRKEYGNKYYYYR